MVYRSNDAFIPTSFQLTLSLMSFSIKVNNMLASNARQCDDDRYTVTVRTVATLFCHIQSSVAVSIVEVAVLGSPTLIVLMVSVDVKQH